MPPCRFCGQEMSEAALRLHEDKFCPKRDSDPQPIAQVQPEPAPVPEMPKIQAVSTSPNGHRISVPGIDDNYVLPQGIIDKMSRVERQSAQHPVRVLMLGHKGSGKTSAAVQFAAIYNRPCYIAPCSTMQEPQEWWGETKFTPDRGTYYVTSLFIEAVETPRAVVVLDDADRVENPKVLNPLLPLLDDRSKSWVEQVGRYVVVAEGVVFFATVNEGWEYVGSDPLDLALRDRFYEVKLDVPPEEMLAGVIRSKAGVDSGIAAQLAMFVTKARENATMPVMISTRKVLLAAEDVALGATMRDAILYSIIPGLSIDQQEAILQVLQQSMGETQLRTNDDHGVWRNWK